MASNSFVYIPSSADWTFVATSDIIDPVSAIASGEASEGEREPFVFIQNNTSFSQDIEFLESVNYAISFYEVGRIVTFQNATGNLQYEITIDGASIYQGSTETAQACELIEASIFATSGIHRLKYEGINPVVIDNIIFFMIL